MPNWVFVSFSLSGPNDEIERFRRTCIRFVEDEDKIGLDFGTLIPEPDAFREEPEEGLNGPKQSAKELTGFDDLYDWRYAHWGVTLNGKYYKEVCSGPDLYSANLYTPWDAPRLIFAALAEQFPMLIGLMAAVEPGMSWISSGLLDRGSFEEIVTGVTPELELIMDQVAANTGLRDAMIRALTRHFGQRPGFYVPTPDMLEEVDSGTFLGQVLAELSPDHARCLTFLFDVERFVGWDDEGSPFYCHRNESCSREEVVQSQANLAFLKADGRCYYPIDRQLMNIVARHLADACDHKEQVALDNDFQIAVIDLLERHNEDELYEWAAHAALRKVALDLTDLDSLRASFLVHAENLRTRAINHLNLRQPEVA